MLKKNIHQSHLKTDCRTEPHPTQIHPETHSLLLHTFAISSARFSEYVQALNIVDYQQIISSTELVKLQMWLIYSIGQQK